MMRQKTPIRPYRMKGVHRVKYAGHVLKYHRKTGTRLPDAPENSAEFLAAFMAAEGQSAKTTTPRRGGVGSIEAVWNLYLRSDEFKGLSPSYSQVRRRDGGRLVVKAGIVPIIEISAAHIRADMAVLEPHPANERRKTWRALFACAVAAGYVLENPTDLVKPRKTPKADSYQPWDATSVMEFRRRWSINTCQRLAFEIMHYTGARISDAIRLGDGMIDQDGWLCFNQQKTGGRVSIPIGRDLPGFVDPEDLTQLLTALNARPERHGVWITTAHGSSRSQKSASQWFAKAARTAGLTNKSAHGLRPTRAIKLAEAGATVHQIGAWTGHASLKEIEHYSREADKKRILSGDSGSPEKAVK